MLPAAAKLWELVMDTLSITVPLMVLTNSQVSWVALVTVTRAYPNTSQNRARDHGYLPKPNTYRHFEWEVGGGAQQGWWGHRNNTLRLVTQVPTHPKNVEESNPMPAVPTVTWVVAMGFVGVPRQLPWCTGQVLCGQ